MRPTVTIVDYGVGNICSVSRAFQQCGADVRFSDSAADILNADRIVLPGVGAFADGMAGLKARNLVEPLTEFARRGKPFLGICLGMQMLMESSEEFGFQEGLKLMSGKVVAIPLTGGDGRPHKIPHIGWNELLVTQSGRHRSTIFDTIGPRSSVYFVHSYQVVPTHEENRLAECDYNGRIICAAVKSGLIFGCQFHPEKSGAVGLKIIESFLQKGV